MSRPAVSVVMPFAGDAAAAGEAVAALLELRTQPADELILADNSGVLAPEHGATVVSASDEDGVTVVSAPEEGGVTVVSVSGERSPAHARNAGASRAANAWILFLDADCRAPAGLLDAYFAIAPAPDVGALAGEVLPVGEPQTVAARYGVARSFLGQAAHLSHPYLPRAVAANLLVRRSAFEQVGGFYEGLRAAEDTDFSWRLQRAGWRLELRSAAAVEHRYRATLRELRSQWRRYAAGRAWLRRRYSDFTPQPALGRVFSRRVHSRRSVGTGDPPRRASSAGRVERAQHAAIDAVLGVEELAGFALSNRPHADASSLDAAPSVVLVADRFPSRGDPLVELARTLSSAHVEASARPEAPWLEVARELDIAYREDDGSAARLAATLWLVGRHPWRSSRDRRHRADGAPQLGVLAPAAFRLARARSARVHPLGGEDVQLTAQRLARLIGRGIDAS